MLKPTPAARSIRAARPPGAARRLLLGLALAACTAALPAAATAAADFPNRPLRLVVAFPPGGAVDVAARIVGTELGRRLGQPVVVDNITGAGGNIGVEKVAKSPGDGYTLLFGSIALAINPSLYPVLPFDTVKDLQPITLVSTSPYVLAVNAASPVRTVQDLVKAARDNPGGIQFASAGSGSGSHLFMELFLRSTGTRMVHVPYRGAAPAMNDVIAGHVPVVFDSIMTVLPYVEAGKVRVLGLSSTTRSKIGPDIPTMQEAGVPGYDATSWFGIFVPSATPPEVARRLNQELAAAIRSPEVSDKLRKLGAEPVGSSMQEMDRFFRSEIAKWRDVVKSANVQVN